jgi:ribosomal protein L17
MPVKTASKTIRRSVALPRQLVEEANAFAPKELRQNLNRLVTVALKEFSARQRERAFAEAMAQMAADPAIQRVCAGVGKEFASTEGDGLGDD